MRLLKPIILAIVSLFASVGLAQIPAPQINLSGNIGCQGFPCVNNGTLIMASDANRTMTAQETSAMYIKVTSSVSLTATRSLIAPVGRFNFTIENATTGGQSVQIIGTSGTGVTIANGTTVAVWNDGTNFVQIGSSGGSGASLVVGTTAISGGTGNGFLYNNGGVLGNAALLAYDNAYTEITGRDTATNNLVYDLYDNTGGGTLFLGDIDGDMDGIRLFGHNGDAQFKNPSTLSLVEINPSNTPTVGLTTGGLELDAGDGVFSGNVSAPSLTLNGGTPLTGQSSANSQVVTCPTGGTTTQYCGADGAWHASGAPASPSLSFQINNSGAFGPGPLATNSTFTDLIGVSINNANTGGDQFIYLSWSCSPNALPGFTPNNLASSFCEHTFIDPTVSGWNLGNSSAPSGGGSGWYNYDARSIEGVISSAGIKGTDQINVEFAGVGDAHPEDHNTLWRGGSQAYSDEGFQNQDKRTEAPATSGTIVTGGSGATTLVVTRGNNSDGIGHEILDSSFDVIATTQTFVSQTSTRAVVSTAATVPVSTSCSTVASDAVISPAQIEGTYISVTFNVNTAVDLTGHVGELMTTVSPYVQTAVLASVGTLSAGVQPVTLMLNKSVASGSDYCLGGLSGRGLEETQYTIGGNKYVHYIIGSPTANSMWVTDKTAEGPAPFAVQTGAVNIYHMAVIVGINNGTNTFTISPNDAQWATSSTWNSPNSLYSIWGGRNELHAIFDPYALDNGNTIGFAGTPQIESPKLDWDQNQIDPSFYYEHGGAYVAPVVAHISGPWGVGQYWDNSPDSGGLTGQRTTESTAISMGPPAAGNTNALWGLASYRANGDHIAYNTTTRQWEILGGSGGPTVGMLINGSSVCTVANALCGGSGTGTVTHIVGPLTSGDCVIGNGAADIKVDPNCSLDGSGNLTVASVTSSGTSNGAFTATVTGTPATAPGTNQFQISPTSITTPWTFDPAAAPGTGFMLGTNTAGVVQQSFVGSTGTGNVVLAGSPTFSSSITLGGLTGLTQCLQVSTSGAVSGTGSACGSGGGAVSSVSNSDGTLTVTPTTGAVFASLALSHANTWSGLQTYSAGINLSGTTSPLQLAGSAGTSGNCLISGGTGVTPSWSSCGAGGSGITGGVSGFFPLYSGATTINGSGFLDYNITNAGAITSTVPIVTPNIETPSLTVGLGIGTPGAANFGGNTNLFTLFSNMVPTSGAFHPTLAYIGGRISFVGTVSGGSAQWIGEELNATFGASGTSNIYSSVLPMTSLLINPTILVNPSSTGIFSGIEEDITASSLPSGTNYFIQGKIGGTQKFAVDLNGVLSTVHEVGIGTAPTIAGGTGSGTATPTLSKQTDMYGVISVTPAGTPVGTVAVATVTFGLAYGSAPVCYALPANAATQALTGIAQAQVLDANTTTTTFTLTQGATPLVVGTAYAWTYQCN